MSISRPRNSLLLKRTYSLISILDRSLYWVQIYLPVTLRSLLQPQGLSNMVIIYFLCDNSSNIWRNLLCKLFFPPPSVSLSSLLKTNHTELLFMKQRQEPSPVWLSLATFHLGDIYTLLFWDRYKYLSLSSVFWNWFCIDYLVPLLP